MCVLLFYTILDAFHPQKIVADGVNVDLLSQDYPTDWKAFPSSQLPRFKVARQIVWHKLDMEQVKSLNNREFKIQLAFERGLFQTSWIALYSYNPLLVLKRCDIVFIYNDGHIVDLKVYPECTF